MNLSFDLWTNDETVESIKSQTKGLVLDVVYSKQLDCFVSIVQLPDPEPDPRDSTMKTFSWSHRPMMRIARPDDCPTVLPSNILRNQIRAQQGYAQPRPKRKRPSYMKRLFP